MTPAFTDFDREMMRLAIGEARLATAHGDIPVGAVIARGGEVIAAAHNTRERDGDPLGHAEIGAIRMACEKLGAWRLTGCTLYVTLEPCCMCAGAIVQSRISRAVFGAWDRRAGCAGSVYRITEDPALMSYCPADGGLMADECEALIRIALRDARSGGKEKK